MSVGENIRRIREERQVSQAYLANHAGIAQPIASAAEKNPVGFFSANRRLSGGSSRKAAACA